MSTSALVGRRVRWAGPTYRDEVSAAYRAAVAAGPLRPPRPDERRELRPGDEGLVVELLDVDQADDTTRAGCGRYVLRFGDVEIEATLPGGLALVLDQDGHPPVTPSPTPAPGLLDLLAGLTRLLFGHGRQHRQTRRRERR